jgi:hypothetical protein
MADAAGLGPVGGNTVGVQIPPPAPSLCRRSDGRVASDYTPSLLVYCLTINFNARTFKLSASPRKGTFKLKTTVKLEGEFLTSKGGTGTAARETMMTK